MKQFLDKYDTIIFDLDGVITSEQMYWDCSALTVSEYLKLVKNEAVDTVQMEKDLASIRKKVFCDDALIGILKDKGVNSNWDLAYVTVCIALILDIQDDFEPVMEYAKNIGDDMLAQYDILAKSCAEKMGGSCEEWQRDGIRWKDMQNIFQEWLYGEEWFLKNESKSTLNGKKAGLMYQEKPLMALDKTRAIVEELSKTKRLCTGTGRPYYEMLVPLTSWGIIDFFDKNGLSNFNHVVKAQRVSGNNKLTKPHPYVFLKALYGTDYDDKKLVNGDYDKAKLEKTLVIGDAGADIFAAQAMGVDFCAVLTGINGEKTREFFEKNNATYIFNSILELNQQ